MINQYTAHTLLSGLFPQAGGKESENSINDPCTVHQHHVMEVHLCLLSLPAAYHTCIFRFILYEAVDLDRTGSGPCGKGQLENATFFL